MLPKGITHCFSSLKWPTCWILHGGVCTHLWHCWGRERLSWPSRVSQLNGELLCVFWFSSYIYVTKGRTIYSRTIDLILVYGKFLCRTKAQCFKMSFTFERWPRMSCLKILDSRVIDVCFIGGRYLLLHNEGPLLNFRGWKVQPCFPLASRVQSCQPCKLE